MRIGDASVFEHGREEVGDELPKVESIALATFNFRDFRSDMHTPLPASCPLMHMRMRARIRQRAFAVSQSAL